MSWIIYTNEGNACLLALITGWIAGYDLDLVTLTPIAIYLGWQAWYIFRPRRNEK